MSANRELVAQTQQLKDQLTVAQGAASAAIEALGAERERSNALTQVFGRGAAILILLDYPHINCYCGYQKLEAATKELATVQALVSETEAGAEESRRALSKSIKVIS